MTPRYVILRHEVPASSERPSHWDLMLETDALLRTWALEALPSRGETVRAEPLADHRAMYLEYEGPISGDRGSVSQWDRGTYELESESADETVIRLTGTELQCRLRIWRDAQAQSWVQRLD